MRVYIIFRFLWNRLSVVKGQSLKYGSDSLSTMKHLVINNRRGFSFSKIDQKSGVI